MHGLNNAVEDGLGFNSLKTFGKARDGPSMLKLDGKIHVVFSSYEV